jgi:hypothetical protein
VSHLVYDNTSVPFPKTNLVNLEPGDDPLKFIQDADWNTVCQGVIDIKTLLRGAKYYGLLANSADPAPGPGVPQYAWMRADGGFMVHKPDNSTVELLSSDRAVNAGAGLTGGGSLVTSISLAHATGPLGAGAYTSVTGVTVDAFGHVTAVVQGSSGPLVLTADGVPADDTLDAATLSHTHSAGQDGIGVGLLMKVANSVGTLKDAARVNGVLSVAGSGSEVGQFRVDTLQGGVLGTAFSASAAGIGSNAIFVNYGEFYDSGIAFVPTTPPASLAGGVYALAPITGALRLQTATGTALQLGVGTAMGISLSGTGLASMRDDAVGIGTTEKLLIENLTAATVGNQKYSPVLALVGKGWDTGASASRDVRFGLQTRPVQGNPAGGELHFLVSVNGAAYSSLGNVSAGGTWTLPGVSGGGYATIQNVGTPVAQETTINLTAELVATPDTGKTQIALASTLNAKTIRGLTVAPNAATGNPGPVLTVTPPTHTDLTASTEIPWVSVPAATWDWNAGAIATQRFFSIGAPTMTFDGASVVTNVYTAHIAAPVAGASATFTNAAALGLSAAVLGTYGLEIEKNLGAAGSNRYINLTRQGTSRATISLDASDGAVLGVSAANFTFSTGGILDAGVVRVFNRFDATQPSPTDTITVSNDVAGQARVVLNGSSNDLHLGAGNNTTTHLVLYRNGKRVGINKTPSASVAFDVTMPNETSGVPQLAVFTGATAHTGITASTEATQFDVNLAQVYTWAGTGGAAPVTTQRFFRIQAPEIAFANANTVSEAFTAYIAAPIAGTNATLTSAAALGLEATTAPIYCVTLDKVGAAAANNKILKARRATTVVLDVELDASDNLSIISQTGKILTFKSADHYYVETAGVVKLDNPTAATNPSTYNTSPYLRFEYNYRLSEGAATTGTMDIYAQAVSTGRQELRIANSAVDIAAFQTNGGGMFLYHEDSIDQIANLLTLRYTTSGTAGTGIGTSLLFQAEDAGGSVQDVGNVAAVLSVATAGSEKGYIRLQAANGSGSPGDGLYAWGTGKVGIGTSTTEPGAALHVVFNDAVDNDVTIVGRFTHSTSGTVANSIGTALALAIENSAGTMVDACELSAIFTDKTDGSEDSYYRFRCRSAGTMFTIAQLASDGAFNTYWGTNIDNTMHFVTNSVSRMQLSSGGIGFHGTAAAARNSTPFTLNGGTLAHDLPATGNTADGVAHVLRQFMTYLGDVTGNGLINVTA